MAIPYRYGDLTLLNVLNVYGDKFYAANEKPSFEVEDVANALRRMERNINGELLNDEQDERDWLADQFESLYTGDDDGGNDDEDPYTTDEVK